MPTDPEATAEGCRRVGTSNDVPTAYAKAYAGSGSVQEQEIEDKVQDKRSLKEYKDPFNGS